MSTRDVPGFARTADEGFDEVAEWFETLAGLKEPAGRFTEGWLGRLSLSVP